MAANEAFDVVHCRNKQPDKNGCFNRPPFSKGYWAPDRKYRPDGTFEVIQTFILHRNTTDCQFDQIYRAELCEGCQHIKDKR